MRERGSCDHAAMVVVGTHGHGPAVGALLGSVSNGLLHKATVPVLLVRGEVKSVK